MTSDCFKVVGVGVKLSALCTTRRVCKMSNRIN